METGLTVKPAAPFMGTYGQGAVQQRIEYLLLLFVGNNISTKSFLQTSSKFLYRECHNYLTAHNSDKYVIYFAII